MGDNQGRLFRLIFSRGLNASVVELPENYKDPDEVIRNKVCITVEKRGTCLELAIRDNGRGFSSREHAPANLTEGLGLSSMRERTTLSGGSFLIDSVEGKGTAIKAVCPLD